jgi:hypothetical protein
MARRPDWSVGSGEGSLTFERVVAGALLRDGGAVIADGGRAEHLVLISGTGEVRAILGRRGKGPGEFEDIGGITVLGGDTICVQDFGNQRLSLFSGASFVRDVPLRQEGNLTLLGADDTGRLLMGMPLGTYFGRQKTLWRKVPLVRWEPAEVHADTLAEVDWRRFEGANLIRMWGFAVLSNGRFVVGRGDIPELRWLGMDGQPKQILRWHDAPRPLTDGDKSRLEVAYKAVMSQYVPRAELQHALPMLFGQTHGPLPLFAGLMADDRDNIWVELYRLPYTSDLVRYNVVSAEGNWIRSVTVGPGDRFTLLAIRAGRLLVRQRDTLGVQSVGVYEVHQ